MLREEVTCDTGVRESPEGCEHGQLTPRHQHEDAESGLSGLRA